jgi:hypothetical protein
MAVFPGGTPALEGPPRYYADVRAVAAEALGAMGREARDALEALRKARHDPDPAVGKSAEAAIQAIEQP